MSNRGAPGIVKKVRIDGEIIFQDEIPKEKYKELLEERLDEEMDYIGFERRKTA